MFSEGGGNEFEAECTEHVLESLYLLLRKDL